MRSKEGIKHLGVMFDNRLKFKVHVEYVEKKGALLHAALSRMLANIGELKYVTSSVLLFTAPVRAAALTTKEFRRSLMRSYKLCAPRVIIGFQTTSDDAALIINGLLLVDILVEEMSRIHISRITIQDVIACGS